VAAITGDIWHFVGRPGCEGLTREQRIQRGMENWLAMGGRRQKKRRYKSIEAFKPIMLKPCND
jgi:hypothetical protein